MVTDEMLTTAEVADLFRVSQLTIRRWCASGMLPALKLGRGWRISKERLDSLIEEQIDIGMAQRDPSVWGNFFKRGH